MSDERMNKRVQEDSAPLTSSKVNLSSPPRVEKYLSSSMTVRGVWWMVDGIRRVVMSWCEMMLSSTSLTLDISTFQLISLPTFARVILRFGRYHVAREE